MLTEPNKVKVVGQLKLRLWISKLKEKEIPHYINIEGQENSGKEHIANYIASYISHSEIIYLTMNSKQMRTILKGLKETTEKFVLILPDLHNASQPVSNLLLKFTENPPENVWIITTSLPLGEDYPSPLTSRAHRISLDKYSRMEIAEFTENPDVLDVAETPGEALILNGVDLTEIKKLVKQTIDTVQDFSWDSMLALNKYICIKNEDETKPTIHTLLKLFEKELEYRLLHEDNLKKLSMYLGMLKDTKVVDISRFETSPDKTLDRWVFLMKRRFNDELHNVNKDF